MPKDELRRLPDHVTAQLLRALLCIPRGPESRMVLAPIKERRPPFWTLEDHYDVLYRGRRAGHIEREPKPEPVHAHVPWRWFIDYGIDGAVENNRSKATHEERSRGEPRRSDAPIPPSL